MQVGIISPIKFLKEFCVTNTYYCLPDLFCKNKEYRAFLTSRDRILSTFIVDCSKPGWNRKPEELDVVLDCVEFLKPQMVILPSVMFNYKKTLEISERYKEPLEELNCSVVMGCLEGTNIDEIVKCWQGLDTPTYAVPCHIYKTLKGHKLEGVDVFIDNFETIDEIDYKDSILVTSLPIRLGLQGRLLSDPKPSPPSLTFYEEENKFPLVVRKNIQDTIRLQS